MKRSAILLLCAVMMLAGCSSRTQITNIDPNNLENIRVAVGLGWSPDYILSRRDDVTLLRFNELGNMMLAIKCGQADAISLDYASAKYLQAAMPALVLIPEPLAVDDFVLLINKDREDIREQFNNFISSFRETEAYADIIYRAQNFIDGEYAPKDVEQTGQGEVLRMTAEPVYPYVYYDFADKTLKGSDIEIAKHFANSEGYRLEIEMLEFTAASSLVETGKADFMMSALSSEYGKVSLECKTHIVSDSYMQSGIHLLVMGDSSKFIDVPTDMFE